MLQSIALPRRVLLVIAAAGTLSVGCSSMSVADRPEAAPGGRAASGAARVPPSRPNKSTGPSSGDAAPSPDYDLSGPLLFQLMSAEVAVQRGELWLG